MYNLPVNQGKFEEKRKIHEPFSRLCKNLDAFFKRIGHILYFCLDFLPLVPAFQCIFFSGNVLELLTIEGLSLSISCHLVIFGKILADFLTKAKIPPLPLSFILLYPATAPLLSPAASRVRLPTSPGRAFNSYRGGKGIQPWGFPRSEVEKEMHTLWTQEARKKIVESHIP